MFVQSLKFIAALDGKRDQVSVFGQESNLTTWRMARMNLAIRGIEAHLGAKHADSFREDLPGAPRAVRSDPQFFLLIALYEEDDIPIFCLGTKAALDKSSLTGILDRLERDGLLERVASPDDRRAIHVRLAPKARELKPALTCIYEETNQAFLSRLTDEERAVLDRVVDKLEERGRG